MSSFGRFTQAIGGVVETLSYSSPTLTLTQSEGSSPLTATIPAGVSGSGTSTFFPKWNGASSLNNSLMFQSAIDGIGINTGASSNRFLLTTDASVAKIFSFRSANLPRWALRVDGTESGSGAGADFAIRRYNDAGTFVDAPLFIKRSNGNVSIGTTYNGRKLNIGGSAYVDMVLKSTSASGVAGGGTLYFGNSADEIAYVNYDHASNFMSFATNNSEKMRITSAGGVILKQGLSLSDATVTTSGIEFPSTQVASASANNLDDYEEGTWTMGISFDGASIGIVYSENIGNYVKIGKQVTATGYLTLINKGSSTGIAKITGLPFLVGGLTGNYSAPSFWFDDISFTNQYQGYGNIGETTIDLRQISLLGADSAITNTDFANNSRLMVTLTYFV